nr:immunoglobulin heavy chain junction region [Mus musculus]
CASRSYGYFDVW